jgi:hypothetical protein
MSDDYDDYFEDEDETDSTPSVNGPKGIRVMAEQCSTCIFRPGTLMHLRRGRLRDMVRQTAATDSNVICHQTLNQPLGALCRGSVEEHMGQLARIAYRLNAVEEVAP